MEEHWIIVSGDLDTFVEWNIPNRIKFPHILSHCRHQFHTGLGGPFPSAVVWNTVLFLEPSEHRYQPPTSLPLK